MNVKLLLILSAGLNLLLAAMLLRPVAPSPVGREAGALVQSAAPPVFTLPGAAPSKPGTVTNTVVREINWQQVESPDYLEYIANLRAIGCPEETIRDIIVADVNKLYADKKRLARGEPKQFEFWKAGNPMGGVLGGDSETLKQMRALEEEKNSVLRTLGIEPDPMNPLMAMAGGNPMEIMFEFLPDSKRAEVMKIMADFQTRMMESHQDGSGDQEMKAHRDMEQSIREALTPEEFLDYQLRLSMTAQMMRGQIAGFDPSEEEFLAVFKLREQFDREHSPFGMFNATAEEQRTHGEAREKLNQRIRETLGETRFADYQRAQDHGYQQLNRIVQRAALPASVARDVHDMQMIAQEQAGRVRLDQQLTQEQRAATLRAIRQETERSIQQTLGDEAWEQYNRPNNVWWLRNIASE